MGDNKNFILAIGLCVIVLFGWQALIGVPQRDKVRNQQEQSQKTTIDTGIPQPVTGSSQSPQPQAGITAGNVPLPGGAVTPSVSRHAVASAFSRSVRSSASKRSE